MPKLPKSTLAQLEKLLVSEIPAAVQAANLTEPVYCARIWYNGTERESATLASSTASLGSSDFERASADLNLETAVSRRFRLNGANELRALFTPTGGTG